MVATIFGGASMTDLFRFLLLRAPQAIPTDEVDVVTPSKELNVEGGPPDLSSEGLPVSSQPAVLPRREAGMPRALAVVFALVATLIGGALQAGAEPQSGQGPNSTRSVGSLFADFDGNGVVDLAVGSPGENVGAIADAGAVNVFYGSAGGLPTTSQLLLQNPEAGDRFGAALAAGFFHHDGFADLAVGSPGENVGAIADAGAVSVFYGSAGGLSTTSQLLLQNPEAGDRFGAALIAGLLDATGNWDLAVGSPWLI
jgi:hypothetical protein